MLYVCSDCGVIAKGDGTVVEKATKPDSSKCAGGNHLWRMTTEHRMSGVARKAVEEFNKKSKAAK